MTINTLFNLSSSPEELPTEMLAADSVADHNWQSVLARDRAQDGAFVFAVSSTGIYCRPSCPAEASATKQRNLLSRARCRRKGWLPRMLALQAQVFRRRHNLKLVKSVCRYIEQHLDESHHLASARELRLAKAHFTCSGVFKAVLGVTPRAYAESCRMKQLKRNLQAGHSVTRAMYDAGYSSSSRLYERTASHLGMSPDKYRRGSIAATIRYSRTDLPLGRMLVAATAKGICAIQFADSDEELEHGLKHEFPFAIRRRDDNAIQQWTQELLRHLSGQKLNPALPPDIQATAFQRRVWSYLQSIPFGETRSYSDVAKDIGQPTAARAVARACATNRIAVAIPCHRVVREIGDLAGYRWGSCTKKTLWTWRNPVFSSSEEEIPLHFDLRVVDRRVNACGS